jgi:3-oxoacyl-[acyl-carrier-protein] synthase-1
MATNATPMLAITGVGAISPVGCSAIETCASVRADICRFCEWPRYTPLTADPDWEEAEPLVASCVPDVTARAPGPDRLVELATLALRDLVSRAPLRRAALAQAALFLALPEPDAASGKWALGPEWGRRICAHAGLPAIPVASARCEGSPGSLAILSDVQLHLGRQPTTLAIVVFVDSYIDEGRLAALDHDARLKSARTTDGIVPGEAGVAILVESPGSADQRRAVPLGLIGPVGLGQEPQIRSSDKESSGRGLSEALRATLVNAPPKASRWCLCDLNGQSYRAAEWGVVLARLAAQLSTVNRLSHPADCLGDIGAATGGILVAQALAGFARGYARADEAILWASSSEHGLRAAVRITPGKNGDKQWRAK